MNDKKINISDDVEISLVDNDKLIKLYQDIEAFLKFVDEEIKKTDAGDGND